MFCLSDFFGGSDSNSALQEIDLFSRPALLLLSTRYSEIHIFQSPYCFFSFLFSVLIPLSKWTRFFASLVKRNLRLKFFICGTCSGVDRLKLPLKVFQKSDSVCSVFEMTNVIVIKKEIRNFSCFCQATLWKLLGLGEVWNVLSAIHYPRVWITVSNSPNNL